MAPVRLVPDLVVDGLRFPEAPRWWDGQLWFSDVYGLRVYRMNGDGSGLTVVAELPDWPSGLGELPDGRRIVVEMRSQRLWQLGSRGGVEPFADLRSFAVNEVNDLAVDHHGRAYSGCYGFDILGGEPPRPGRLLMTLPDGSSRIAAEDLMFPNGIAVTEDGATLLVAQTLGAEVTAFEIEDDGALSGRRPWAELPERSPDGICLDAEGALWVGSSFTSEFLRVERGGRVTHRIEAGGRWALAPMLGGADGRTLYLLSTDTDVERIKAGDMQGRIEAVEVDVPGAPQRPGDTRRFGPTGSQ